MIAVVLGSPCLLEAAAAEAGDLLPRDQYPAIFQGSASLHTNTKALREKGDALQLKWDRSYAVLFCVVVQ